MARMPSLTINVMRAMIVSLTPTLSQRARENKVAAIFY